MSVLELPAPWAQLDEYEQGQIKRLWWEKVLKAGRCWMCKQPTQELYRLGFHLEAHHVVTRGELTRSGLEVLAWTRVDNGMALCAPGTGCHPSHHGWSRRITYDKLRPEHIAFAEEAGKTEWLKRNYPESPLDDGSASTRSTKRT